MSSFKTTLNRKKKVKKRKIFIGLSVAVAAAMIGMPDDSFDFHFTIYGRRSGSGS